MSSSSPFTEEHVAEWASFGPRLKGKPTPEQKIAAQERKEKCKEMKARLAKELNDTDKWSDLKQHQPQPQRVGKPVAARVFRYPAARR